MKASAVLVVLVLLGAALPQNLHATILKVDSKIPPPGDCSQQFLGLEDEDAGILEYDQAGRIPGALDAVEGRGEPGSKVDPSAAWALRARNLKASVSLSDWNRLVSAWGRYITARVDTARIQNRLCTGGELASSFAFDIGYVVMAPFEIAGGISEGSEGDGKAMFAYMILPVAGAAGLAADAILIATLPVTLPIMKFKARRHARRSALAFKEFTDLVVELEGPGQGKT